MHCAGVPEVDAVDSFRGYEIGLQWSARHLRRRGSAYSRRSWRRAFLSGTPPRQVFRQVSTGENVVIVSEPFANKHDVRSGDTIHGCLWEPRLVPFRVLDVYFDYASERGYILTDRRTMLKYLPDPAPSNLALYLKPGVNLEEGRRAVQAAIGGRRSHVLSNRYAAGQGIRIFDRTFAITYALEGGRDIRGDHGRGRGTACTGDRPTPRVWIAALPRRVHRTDVAAGFVRSGVARIARNVAGLALGYVLSLLLVYVINKQSFGWTIQFHWPVAALLGALTLVYVATVVSAVYPARVASRLNPIEVVHEE